MRTLEIHQDQGQRIPAALLRVVLAQHALQAPRATPFVAASLGWFRIQTLLLDVNQNVFEIQTANMAMFVKTKDVSKSPTHVIHPLVVPVQLVLQTALEIPFAGKLYDQQDFYSSEHTF